MLEGQSLRSQTPDASDPASKYAPTWVRAIGNDIPPDAMQGGSEAGHPLYVARAFNDGGAHPGKCGPHMNPPGVHFAYGGREVIKHEYEVLTLSKTSQRFYRWEQISQGITTMIEMKKQGVLKPVTGGYEKDGRPLYVCQAIREDIRGQTVHPGKCGMHMPEGAHYAYGDKEWTTDRFSLLVFDTSMLETETATPSRQPESGNLPRPSEGGAPPRPSEGGYGGNPPGQSGGWGAPPRQSEGGLGSLYPSSTESGYGGTSPRPTEVGYGGFGNPPRPSEGGYGGHSPRPNDGGFGDYHDPPRYTEGGHTHQGGHSHHRHTQGGHHEWSEGITYEPGQVYRYHGQDYAAIQGHTAHPGAGWNPVATPALWRRCDNC